MPSINKIRYEGTDYDILGEEMANKANIDGSYQSMTVGNAEQLVSSVGIDNSVPYNFRTSGGSADIGDRLTDKAVGGTIAWNQQLKNGNFANGTTNWIGSSAILTVTDGVARCTLDGDAWNNDIRQVNATVIDGHIYLIGALVRQSSTDFSIMFRNPGGQGASYYFSGTGWTRYATFINVTSSAPNGFALSVRENGTTLTDEWFEAQNINCFDLTQMFGSTIAKYVYSLEQSTAGAGVAWFKKLFPKDYYEYNAGELMSVQTSSHDTVGFNAWDEEWELGSYDSSGQPSSSSTSIRCKNFIRVIPGATYCYHNGTGSSQAPWFYDANKGFLRRSSAYIATNGTFTIPEDVFFMKFALPGTYGTTYKNDICINLSWDGERDGEYEPYVKHTYPLDSDLVLRGIPKLDASNNLYYDGDIYESDGTVTRRYGVVDLGTLAWAKATTTYDAVRYFSLGLQQSAKKTTSNGVLANIMCGLFYAASANDGFAKNKIGCITLDTAGTVSVYPEESYSDASEFKTAMSGVMSVYELAEPTTETADAYQNPQIVDDFGTEEYVDAGSRDVAIPVGHETFYAANLKAKLEMSPDSPSDGDGDYIVRQTYGINEYVKMVKELPSAPTTDGSYHLEVTVASGTPTFTWVANE